MQLWNDFINWLYSTDGHNLVTNAILPFLAIIIAGVVAAGIGRSSAKRVIALSDREVKASAVTALISAARKASVWNTLPAPEQQHVDHLIGDADIRLRLLPVAGTALAADWARHEIADMKRNAVSFSFQAEQSLIVFRDRLIDWQARPTRAKKLFKNDLDSWAYDSSLSEQELVHQQQEWAASQVTKTGPIDIIRATAPSDAAPSQPAPSVSAPSGVAPVAEATAPAVPSYFSTAPQPVVTPSFGATPIAPEPEAPATSRIASRFARPDESTPVAQSGPESVELIEPTSSFVPIDRHEDFEGTPSFIEPDAGERSASHAAEELPEIVIHDTTDSQLSNPTERSAEERN